jgi:hypothetical protein
MIAMISPIKNKKQSGCPTEESGCPFVILFGALVKVAGYIRIKSDG